MIFTFTPLLCMSAKDNSSRRDTTSFLQKVTVARIAKVRISIPKHATPAVLSGLDCSRSADKRILAPAIQKINKILFAKTARPRRRTKNKPPDPQGALPPAASVYIGRLLKDVD
jgi:hypothetical protein